MRAINPPIAVTFVVVAAMTALAITRHHAEAVEPDERCAVLHAYISDVIEHEVRQGNRAIALSRSPETNGARRRDLNPAEISEARSTDPLFDLHLASEKTSGQSVLTGCPDLIREVSRAHPDARFFLDREEGAWPVNAEGYYNTVSMTLSMPAISSSGDEAILYSGLQYAPLAGGGSEVYLRKNARGKWMTAYQSPTWIS